jgi:hypothetical protein
VVLPLVALTVNVAGGPPEVTATFVGVVDAGTVSVVGDDNGKLDDVTDKVVGVVDGGTTTTELGGTTTALFPDISGAVTAVVIIGGNGATDFGFTKKYTNTITTTIAITINVFILYHMKYKIPVTC